MSDDAFLARTRTKGVNPLVYWLSRAVLQPFFHLYWRLGRIGREHIPAEGGVILAANHRSFLDPFVIAVMCRRPVYFVAKRELFRRPFVAWYLNALGAFPIDRGASDEDAMATAREILERGDPVLIFPEGTRVRPGGLGSPRRGVGRLALQTGAPVVPVAIIGTEGIRTGWRIRPHKIRIRAGRPVTFPRVEAPSAHLAGAVTERIWPSVALQWEWLGGTPPLRRAVVLGAGAWGTAAAVSLARAGLDVQLGCRTPAQVDRIRAAGNVNDALPGVGLGPRIEPRPCFDLDLETADLVVLAVPTSALPAVVAEHGARFGDRAGALVLARGLVGPDGELPAAYVERHTAVRATAGLAGPADPQQLAAGTARLLAAASAPGLAHELRRVLSAAGLAVELAPDLAALELAGAAAHAAALAAQVAEPAGAGAAGAAAGLVLDEIERAAPRLVGASPAAGRGVAGPATAGAAAARRVAGPAMAAPAAAGRAARPATASPAAGGRAAGRATASPAAARRAVGLAAAAPAAAWRSARPAITSSAAARLAAAPRALSAVGGLTAFGHEPKAARPGAVRRGGRRSSPQPLRLADTGELVTTLAAARHPVLVEAGDPAAARAARRREESAAAVARLAVALEAAGARAPVLAGLAEVVEGRAAPADWAAALTHPADARRRAA